MRSIYRFIVKTYGEEESIKNKGEMLFINCPFKESLKIFSYPKWRFRKRKFAKLIEKYNIICLDWLEYSLSNVLYYLLLKNIEKNDSLCFELAGLDIATIIKTKQVLLELEPSLKGSMIFIVVEKDSFEENNILSEFAIYNNTSMAIYQKS